MTIEEILALTDKAQRIEYLKKDVSDNELIVGTEHNTMYYYHLTNDSLLQRGHENPSVVLNYTSPMLLIHYPLNYGQNSFLDYKSKGVYSSTVDIQTQGIMTTTADAYGKMILPSGDTLSPVLRVKTIQTIFDMPQEGSSVTSETDNAGKQLEICRWYSKGYRYPVFETIRNINLKTVPRFSRQHSSFRLRIIYIWIPIPKIRHCWMNCGKNRKATI